MDVSGTSGSSLGLLSAQVELMKQGVDQQYKAALTLIEAVAPSGSQPLASTGDIGTQLNLVA